MELNKIYQGHALKVLKCFPTESVDCVVTSPPYWALRDYGIKGQLGLEATFEEYITKLCDIFDEIKRVLKGPGSIWVNIGDTYANGGRNSGNNKPHPLAYKGLGYLGNTILAKTHLPDKSLCLIPYRFAIEMSRRRWIARNDIIWSKNNPMPESVGDRCTKSHEYVYFFVKSQKYYFDQDAIREPYSEVSLPRALRGLSVKNKWKDGAPGSTANSISQPRKNVRKKFKREYGGGGSSFVGHSGYRTADGRLLINPLGRNKWTVWNVSTASYRGAHFATFPESLIEPMIKAGCPQGGGNTRSFYGLRNHGSSRKASFPKFRRNRIKSQIHRDSRKTNKGGSIMDTGSGHIFEKDKTNIKDVKGKLVEWSVGEEVTVKGCRFEVKEIRVFPYDEIVLKGKAHPCEEANFI